MFAAFTKRCEFRAFRCFLVPVLTVAIVLSVLTYSEASWFMDPGQFHASVHGRISCLECHGNITGERLHPDPAQVNEPLKHFFNPDQCTSCHDGVIQDLGNGTHAGKPVKDPNEYRVCITCHDPHRQPDSSKLSLGFDPSKPVEAQCGVCHAAKAALPALSSADEKCMACHREVAAASPGGTGKVAAFCFECHGDNKGSVSSALPEIGVQAYGSSTHAAQSCLSCHPESAQFGHAGQERTNCLACHHRHDEKVAHDAHIGVGCEACHLSGVTPIREQKSGAVLWRMDGKPGRPSNVHSMTLKQGESSCGRCHTSGNAVGASVMVLPPKSVLCMPCHAATFSAGDVTTIVSLLLFLAGMAILCITWFSGRFPNQAGAPPWVEARKAADHGGGMDFKSRILHVFTVIIFDVFLQKRLFRQSARRWLIHSLIFWPFVFRFAWGMTALLMSLWDPGSSIPWTMLDRNYPLGAFLFDFSGLMILSGVILTLFRKMDGRSEDIGGFPRQDWPALSLLGGIVVIGFILEGIRIAMTGVPHGSVYAFLGYALSRLFAGNSTLPGLYGYVWYLHAVITAALAAYLPFSNLLHVITAPVVLAMNAILRTGKTA
jgi:predicted CXXCH cytochrome family protein